MNIPQNDTIVALSTPQGVGALGLIRISGPNAIAIMDKLFIGRSLLSCPSHQACLGKIVFEEAVLDECVLTLFKGPKSFTGEDVIELSCHGSPYILSRVIDLILKQGIRLAQPGEFTQRAFLHGKMDLSQAEAVGDLIAAQSRSQHQLAMTQMRGGVSSEIEKLRTQLIKFASLIELENDFSEEDVEFADRSALLHLVTSTIHRINELEHTFQYGRAIKQGIAVAIVGQPNVGKSTLLNALLNEDKAIVSNIPGTTRDVIEDTIQLDEIIFRFIDTAGIHETTDTIENIGIERSIQQMKNAQIILWVDEISVDAQGIANKFNQFTWQKEQKPIIILNKIDDFHTCHAYDVEEAVSTLTHRTPTLAISAKKNRNLEKLQSLLIQSTNHYEISAQPVIISNARHMQALRQTRTSLTRVVESLEAGISSDLIAIDIRHALHHLGEIAGTISTDDILDSIFRDFCIGK